MRLLLPSVRVSLAATLSTLLASVALAAASSPTKTDPAASTAAPVSSPAAAPSAAASTDKADAAATSSSASALALFDGKTLGDWKPSTFSTQAKVSVVPAFSEGRPAIVAETSDYLSGITWSGKAPLPRTNYEVSLEAMKIDGDDFFCGLTFPVGEAHCTFVVGGWGGMVVGLSNVDFMDASENATTSGRTLAAKRWYRLRLRVTDAKVEAWIDGDQVIDIERAGRTFSLRQGEIGCSAPLGIAAFQVKAAWRDIQLKRL